MAQDVEIGTMDESVGRSAPKSSSSTWDRSIPAPTVCLRVLPDLDGEEVTDAKADIGYLHRCFEKIAEKRRSLPGDPLHRPDRLPRRHHQRWACLRAWPSKS